MGTDWVENMVKSRDTDMESITVAQSKIKKKVAILNRLPTKQTLKINKSNNIIYNALLGRWVKVHNLPDSVSMSNYSVTPKRWDPKEEGGRMPAAYRAVQGSDSSVCYGVEIESFVLPEALHSVVNSSRVQKIVDNSGGNVRECIMLKHDSSVRGGPSNMTSIEMVSVPMSMEFQKYMWGKIFNSIFKPSDVYSVNDTCGLHIHIDQSKLTRSEVIKLFTFVHLYDNFEFLFRISRRTSRANGFVSYKKMGGLPKDMYRRIVKRHIFGKEDVSLPHFHDHYCALSDSGKPTIELRIFKSPENYDELMVSLEFVEALVEFVQHTPTSEMKWQNFVTFVCDPHMTRTKNKDRKPTQLQINTGKYRTLSLHLLTPMGEFSQQVPLTTTTTTNQEGDTTQCA